MKALQGIGFEGRGAVLAPSFSASTNVIQEGKSAICMPQEQFRISDQALTAVRALLMSFETENPSKTEGFLLHPTS
jgi:hypothetical protein